METNREEYRALYREVVRIAMPFLVRKYGKAKAGTILRKMRPIYKRFLAETPYIGGEENPMSMNLDMALPFFALYEASGRTLTEEDVDELLDSAVVSKARIAGRIVNFNMLERSWLLKPIYAVVGRMAETINRNKGGAWNNTWGIEINPEGHDHGFAMTLVGCPIADFAKAHGYMDILPCLCRGDEKTAEALHGRLIRHHTIAEGAEKCDYWYVGDKNTTDW